MTLLRRQNVVLTSCVGWDYIVWRSQAFCIFFSFFYSIQTVAGSTSTSTPPASHEHELAVSRLTESTEKLLKNVLFETEAIKLNTEQISKDLKSALEKCKVSLFLLFTMTSCKSSRFFGSSGFICK